MRPISPYRRESDGEGYQSIGLDLIRGLAAFFVFFSHARGLLWEPYASLPPDVQGFGVRAFFVMSSFGREAVLAFFVLSGFLIIGQIVKRQRSGSFSLPEYVIDRSTRIMLPLLPAVFLSALILYATGAGDIGFLIVLGNALGLNGVLVPTLVSNLPLWTIAYEIWFYIVGAVFASLLGESHDGHKRAFLLLVAFLCVLVFSKLEIHMLAYWGFGLISVRLMESKRPGMLTIVGIGVIVAGVAARRLDSVQSLSIGMLAMDRQMAQGMICFGLAMIIPYFYQVRFKRWPASVLRFIKFSSESSYSLYLFHYPVFFVVALYAEKIDGVSLTSVAWFCSVMGVAYLVSMLMYFAFERNTRKVRAGLKKWRGVKRYSPRLESP